jgi:DNA polymerase-3 subunit delta'
MEFMVLISGNIIGHHKQLVFLRKMVEQDALPHALLFSGPDGVGKMTIALELVKMLFCSSFAQEDKKENKKPQDNSLGSCQKCLSCKDIDRNVHPDLFILEPVGGNDISIDQIRGFIKNLVLKPVRGVKKIAILNNAHQMRQEGQSALLKTLEESQESALIILLSSKPRMLLPTIRSRVQEIKFFPLQRRELEDALQKLQVPRQEIKTISLFAKGRPGIALQLLKSPTLLTEQNKKLEEFLSLFEANLFSRFRYAKKVAEAEERTTPFSQWMEYTRNVLLFFLKNWGGTKKRRVILDMVRFLNILQERELLIATTNANRQLAIETLMLEMPHLKDLAGKNEIFTCPNESWSTRKSFKK